MDGCICAFKGSLYQNGGFTWCLWKWPACWPIYWKSCWCGQFCGHETDSVERAQRPVCYSVLLWVFKRLWDNGDFHLTRRRKDVNVGEAMFSNMENSYQWCHQFSKRKLHLKFEEAFKNSTAERSWWRNLILIIIIQWQLKRDHFKEQLTLDCVRRSSGTEVKWMGTKSKKWKNSWLKINWVFSYFQFSFVKTMKKKSMTIL